MGVINLSCKLSKLPLYNDTPIMLFPIVKMVYHTNYGVSYVYNVDSKYKPFCFPIRGLYDGYGGIKDIIRDDATIVLEQYYDLTIQQICDVITSNRKDDGYDVNLDCIKEEKGFKGKPVYKERYIELLNLSCMWVHGNFYTELTNKKILGEFNIGNPFYLKGIGFTELDDINVIRYNKVFKKDDLIIHSDGTFIKNNIYTINDFSIKFEEEHYTKSFAEQLYDYVILKSDKQMIENFKGVYSEETILEISKKYNISTDSAKCILNVSSHIENDLIRNLLLNNKFSIYYYDLCLDNKLREVLSRFWLFDLYLKSTGTCYDINALPTESRIDDILDVINKIKEG